jgi:hypothetical protein
MQYRRTRRRSRRQWEGCRRLSLKKAIKDLPPNRGNRRSADRGGRSHFCDTPEMATMELLQQIAALPQLQKAA